MVKWGNASEPVRFRLNSGSQEPVVFNAINPENDRFQHRFNGARWDNKTLTKPTLAQDWLDGEATPTAEYENV